MHTYYIQSELSIINYGFGCIIDLRSQIYCKLKEMSRADAYLSMISNQTRIDCLFKDDGKLDIWSTLRCTSVDTLFKIAIDLGIEVPALVPAIPEKIELKIEELGKDKFQLVHKQIQEAIENCYKKPDYAISMMYSAFETTLKTILHNNNHPEYRSGSNLKKYLPKVLELIKKDDDNIQHIIQNLISIAENISTIRSEKCQSHGKDPTQKIITDSNYAFFCVNAIASVILFLLSTEKTVDNHTVEDDITF